MRAQTLPFRPKMLSSSKNRRSLLFLIATSVLILGGLYYSQTLNLVENVELKPETLNSLMVSSHNCTESTCRLSNVCVDGNSTLSYYSAQNDDAIPSLNLIPSLTKIWDEEDLSVLAHVTRRPEIITNGTFVRGVVVLAKMIGMGDFGTALLQNILPYKRLIQDLNLDASTVQFGLLNDCFNGGQDSVADEDTCNAMRDQIYSIFFGKPALNIGEILEQGNLNLVCFESVVYGIPNTYDMTIKEINFNNDQVKEAAKAVVFKKLEISEKFESKPLEIKIVVSCRRTNRFGKGIKYCKTVLKKVNDLWKGEYKGFAIVVKVVNFDTNLDLAERIKIVSSANIYISDGNEDSFYGLYLRKGAVAMTLPRCSNCQCYHDKQGARLAIGVTAMFLKDTSIQCPNRDCEDWECGQQQVGLGTTFQKDLAEALLIAHQSLTTEYI